MNIYRLTYNLDRVTLDAAFDLYELTLGVSFSKHHVYVHLGPVHLGGYW